jgi:hypothetical protein
MKKFKPPKRTFSIFFWWVTFLSYHFFLHFLSYHSVAITGTGTYLTIYGTGTLCASLASGKTSNRTKRLRQTQQKKSTKKSADRKKWYNTSTRGFLPFRQRLSRHLVARVCSSSCSILVRLSVFSPKCRTQVLNQMVRSWVVVVAGTPTKYNNAVRLANFFSV